MPTVMELLTRHAAICAECLAEHTQSRSDVAVRRGPARVQHRRLEQTDVHRLG
jgi:hypothetical protein